MPDLVKYVIEYYKSRGLSVFVCIGKPHEVYGGSIFNFDRYVCIDAEYMDWLALSVDFISDSCSGVVDRRKVSSVYSRFSMPEEVDVKAKIFDELSSLENSIELTKKQEQAEEKLLADELQEMQEKYDSVSNLADRRMFRLNKLEERCEKFRLDLEHKKNIIIVLWLVVLAFSIGLLNIYLT